MNIPTSDLAATLVRSATMPVWVYTGPLDAGQAFAHDICDTIEYTTEKSGRRGGGDIHLVSTRSDRGQSTTTADSADDAWRVAIGSLLSGDQPYCDFALPEESVADLLAREPDAPGPQAFYDRTGHQPGERAMTLLSLPYESAALAALPAFTAVDTTPGQKPVPVSEMYAKVALRDYAAVVGALPAGATPQTHPDTIVDLCDAIAHCRSAAVPQVLLQRYRGSVPASVVAAAWGAASA